MRALNFPQFSLEEPYPPTQKKLKTDGPHLCTMGKEIVSPPPYKILAESIFGKQKKSFDVDTIQRHCVHIIKIFRCLKEWSFNLKMSNFAPF